MFQFADNHPYVAACVIVFLLLENACYAWQVMWRHFTLRKLGYPPAHCDADGEPIELGSTGSS